MSLLSKTFKKLGRGLERVVKTALPAVAPIASLLPGPLGIAGRVTSGLLAAREAPPSFAEPMMPSLPGAGMVQQVAFPGLPALGALGARALPMITGAGRAVVAGGRGLVRAADRWCRRNPTACAALGGATGVLGAMQRGEIARPRRRINPLNVRAARRAIRRIKAVRKITAEIERAMPVRRARSGGSPGFITRREASRALRR